MIPEFVSANSPHLGRIWLVGINMTQVTLIYDIFHDSNGTSLSSHAIAPINAPATSWTTGYIAGGSAGTWTITSNTLQVAQTASGTLAYVNTGKANGTVTAVCNFLTESTYFTIGVLFRYTDASNLWLVQISEIGNALQMYEAVSGSYTQRASTSFAPAANTAYTLVVSFSGSTITATVNGANQITYGSAASGLSATKHGLWVGSTGSPTGTSEFTSFKVTNP